MSRIAIRPALLADVQAMAVRFGAGHLVGPRVSQALASGVAFAGEASGRLVGVAGLTPIRLDHAEAWAWIDPLAPMAWRPLVPFMRELIGSALEERFFRIEAYVPVSFAPGLALARHLGFSIEGIKTAFGPHPERADCIVFARVRGR